MLEFQYNKKIEFLTATLALAEIVGLELIIKEEAYDMFGNRLPNSVAVYYDKDIEGNSEKMGILLEFSMLIHCNLTKQLVDCGVDKRKILKTSFDMVTWEKYFPEAKGKVVIPDLIEMYEEAKAYYYEIKSQEM